MPDIFTDKDLIAGCLAGRPEALECFVRRYSGPIQQAILFTLRRKHRFLAPADVEDLQHALFVLLFEHGGRKLRQYEGKNGCSLGTWLQTVTLRMVLNHLRDEDIHQEKSSELLLNELQRFDENSVLEEMEKREQLEKLRQAAAELPSREKVFFRLHYEAGLTLEEVAATLHLSRANADVMKHRIIKKLKAKSMEKALA